MDSEKDLTHWRVFWANSWVLFVAIGISALVATLSLTVPFFILLIYDRVINSRSLETLLAICIIAIAILIAHGLLDYSRKRAIARFAGNLQADLEGSLVGPAGENKSDETVGGDLGTQELDALRSFLHSGGIIGLVDAMWVPFFILALYVINPLFGYLALAGCAAIAAIHYSGIWFTKYRARESSTASQKLKNMSEVIKNGDRLRRNQMVRNDTVSEYLHYRSESRRYAIWTSDMATAFQVGGSTIRTILTVFTIALGATLVLSNDLTIGGMVATAVLMNRVYSPFLGFISVLPALRAAAANWEKLGIALTQRNKGLKESIEINSKLPVLCAVKLSVSSDLESNQILSRINFKAHAGQLLQISGASSSGKTLFAEVLSGLRSPTKGKVFCYGVPYSAISPLALGSKIGYVPEIPFFFNGTISANIVGHLGDGGSKDVEHAAQLSGAHPKILELPAGYATRISELGSPLSKGLKEQLVLARALYKDPPIIIVDEPSLARTDMFKQDGFNGVANYLKSGKVIVVFTRNFSTLPLVSDHYRIENGRVLINNKAHSSLLDFSVNRK